MKVPDDIVSFAGTISYNYTRSLQPRAQLIAHPHLLVRATSERFPKARATFRSVLASESHWLQPLLVLTVRWWPNTSKCGWGMS